LSSFPTEDDEDEVVLFAELCLRLRLTSSVLLSDLDPTDWPEVVVEAKEADCEDGRAEDFPLAVANEQDAGFWFAVSSVGRCS